jgi:hypothetical protein
MLNYTLFHKIIKQNDSLGKYLPLKVFTCSISDKMAVKTIVRSAVFGPISVPPPPLQTPSSAFVPSCGGTHGSLYWGHYAWDPS